jgi:hypothetical protein
METLCSAFQLAKEYNLEVEVVWSALQAMKADPTQTVEEAIQEGLNEWMK